MTDRAALDDWLDRAGRLLDDLTPDPPRHPDDAPDEQ